MVEPNIIKEASIVGKVEVPKPINYKNYNIRKFSEFTDKDKALKKINSHFKNELVIFAKNFSFSSSTVTEENYADFTQALGELRTSNSDIISQKSIIKLYAVLTTFDNNINNEIVDESINNIKQYRKKARSLSDSEAFEKTILTDIATFLPSNKAIENLIEVTPSRLRGFGDPAANAYAKKHANSPNTSKYVYLSGADCTNFVSQVVRAGGRSMNSTWKYDKALGAKNNYSTYAWKNAQGFKTYYKPAYNSTNFKNFSYNVFPGTAVVADWYGDGKADHAGWVTNANSFWKEYKDQSGKKRTYMNFMVAQHTTNYHLWVSNNGNNWERMGSGDRYYVIYFV